MDILKLLRKKAPLFNPTHKRVKTPTVLQMEALECGAASLAMILAYYGSYIPLEQLRVACGVSRDGSKASNVVKAARRFGLEADGYKRELTGLMKISYPAVIFWNFNHFVVLEGFSGRKAYINDPGGGRRAVSYNDFSESYTGVVLEFSKSEQFKPVGKKPSIIPAIRKRMAGLNHIAVYILLAGLFLIVPGFIVPAFSRFFVDDILIKHMTGFFKPLLLAMTLTGIIQVVIQCLQQFCMQRFHISFSLSSACKFMQHLFLLPSEFFVQRMPGEISSRIALNPNIADLITTKLTGALINLICIVFYGILMFRYDVKLTCLCLVVCALNFLVLKLSENSIKVGSLKLQMEAGKLGGQTMGGIGMMESIKASGLENDFFQQWAGQQAKVVLQEQKMTVLSIAVTNIPQALTKLLNLAVLAVGALEVMNGRMTMGMLTAFQSLQVSFINPVNLFMGLATEIQTAKADMQRLDDVMDYPVAKRYLDDFHPERVAADTDYSFVSANDKLQGALTFKNVTFGYSRLEPPLIKDLNIDLKPGMRVALVGSTGSGKSTIGKLVSSQYQPWSGEILYDGLPLSEIERSRFTSSVACVDQDIFLFEGTVKENITMWDTAIPEDMYVQAAKDACIHDIITERPGGYSAKLNEGGANLSGGQRQRLEIARALAINPRILVLDEATSALDAVTEMQVDEHIRQRGCTCVIIAHRLSTIRDCDEIIVLDKGKVVQRGTHESLVAEDGLYADLIRTM